MKEKKEIRFDMRADAATIKRLEDQARRAGLSKSEYIRRLIERDAKTQPAQ